MTTLDEALMALQKKWRLSSNATSNDRWDDGYQVACEDHADELAALLTTRQEVAPVALEATPMKDGQFGGREVAFRMDAYYYNFGMTGIAVIDTILSAVACAGKAYHHTEDWNNDSDPYHDRLRGNSPSDWIQHAADDAASAIRGLSSTAHEQTPVAWVMRSGHGTFFRDGPIVPAENVGWRPLFDGPTGQTSDARDGHKEDGDSNV